MRSNLQHGNLQAAWNGPVAGQAMSAGDDDLAALPTVNGMVLIVQMATVMFCGALSSVVLALEVSGSMARLGLVWPVTGVAAALAVPLWNAQISRRVIILASVAFGTMVGSIACGVPVPLALLSGAITAAELLVFAAIALPHIRHFADLQQRDNALRLLMGSLAAPILGGLLRGLPQAKMLHLPTIETAFSAALGDSLGITMVVPFALLLRDAAARVAARRRNRMWAAELPMRLRRPASVMACVFFAVVVVAVFAQTSYPFLFMVFPPLILLTLVVGLEGAVVGSVMLSAIGWYFTLHHQGPIWLMRQSSPLQQLLVLQLFVWVYLATAVPVGAVLDERRRAESKLRTAHMVQDLLMRHTGDVIVLAAADDSQRYASPGIERLTGWRPAEYLALEPYSTVHPDDRDGVRAHMDTLVAGGMEIVLRFRILRRDGSWQWTEAVVRSYGDGRMEGYVGTLRDATLVVEREQTWERERASLAAERSQLATLAATDPLTGLLNRRGLAEAIRNPGRRASGGLAVLALDIDYFKQFNDANGHAVGDECLVHVARALSARIGRHSDTVARVGGEEFAILLPGADQAGALAVAADIQAGIRAIAIQHRQSPHGLVTLSIGISVAIGTVDDDAVHTLMEHADAALYASKRRGRNRYSVWEPSMDVQLAV